MTFPPQPDSPQVPTCPPPEALNTRSTHRAPHTDTMESDDSRPPWLEDVMAAIATCQSTLTTKIEAVQLDMGLIRQDIDKIRSRVAETEQRLSTSEDTIAEHGASLRTLQTKVKALEYRAEDAENRKRRNNLRIVGLPEGQRGTTLPPS